MKLRDLTYLLLRASAAGLALFALGSASPAHEPTASPQELPLEPEAYSPMADSAEPGEPGALSPALGDMSLDETLGKYVAPLGTGRAVLTLDPRLQERIEKVLADSKFPWASTVLLEPHSGRILALAQHSESDPSARGLAFQAFAPAASIFKIVTSAALLDLGIGTESEVCFHGGKHRIAPALLRDNPRRDRRCLTLELALGQSANVVFAKLAQRDLTSEMLRSQAERFLFNAPIPFRLPVEVSSADIPEDPFAFATTAAGFGAVRMSPLHAALLAAIVANGGVFVPPEIIESTEGVSIPDRAPPRRTIESWIAVELAAMMRSTVTEGTARRAFRDSTLGPALRIVTVAGKTGSLAEQNPYRDYSWFIGFAPVDDPQVAIATLVVNGHRWRARAPAVAREALRAYFEGEGREAPVQAQGEQRTALR
jgi:cell division protein FtsI/penicillin-binding protein 2